MDILVAMVVMVVKQGWFSVAALVTMAVMLGKDGIVLGGCVSCRGCGGR